MENASKALIIAGAILLSILIISLGMLIYQNATSSVSHTDLSEQEIQTFNAKFLSYEGNSVSGTRVNALIKAVRTSNIVESRDKTGKYIRIVYPSKDKENRYWATVNKLGNEVHTDPVSTASGLTYVVLMKKTIRQV